MGAAYSSLGRIVESFDINDFRLSGVYGFYFHTKLLICKSILKQPRVAYYASSFVNWRVFIRSAIIG